MRKLSKIAAIAGAVLAATILLGVLALTVIFEPNDYRAYLAERLERITGREVRIEQDLGLSYWPWLAIEAGGITLGNAPGFEARPFATLRRGAARVRLLPLLSGRIELGRIELEGLSLHLARDAAGRGNWEDLLSGRDREESGAAPEASAARDIDIAGIRVSDATLSWYETDDRLRYVVDLTSLDTGPIADATPIAVALRLVARDVVAEQGVALELTTMLTDAGRVQMRAEALEATFELTGSGNAAGRGSLALAELGRAPDGSLRALDAELELAFPAMQVAGAPLAVRSNWDALSYDPAAHALTIDGLTASSAELTSQWTVRAESLSEQPRLHGHVELEDQPLAAVLALAEVEPPTGVTPAALGRFDLRSDFEIEPTAQRIVLPNLTLMLLGLPIEADARLDERRLTARFVLPNSTVMPVLRTALAAWLPVGLDLDAVDQLALAADIDADLDTGAFAIRNAEATLLGAELGAELAAAPNGANRRYSGRLRTSRFEPTALVALLDEHLAAGITPKKLGMLRLQTDFDYDTTTDRLTLPRVALEAFGLAGSGSLTATSLASSPTWSGDVEIAEFSPRALMQRFDQTVPMTSDAAALTAASLTVHSTITSTAARFENLALELDDTRIEGSFAVENYSDPRYAFGLTIDRIDVDRYLPPPAREATAGEPTAGGIELPTEPLSTLALVGDVRVGDLALAGMRFANVSTRLELGAGRAALTQTAAELYGGRFDGSLELRTTDDALPTLALTGRANGLALGALIEDLFDAPAHVDATGAFELELSGRGARVIDAVASSSGRLSFALRDGALMGFNLGATLCRVYNATQRLPRPADAPAVTRFASIEGTASVADGIASTSNLLARAAYMDVSGRGQLALATQQLDYEIDAKLTGPVDVGGCESLAALIGYSVPVKLRGTIAEPEVTPDFSRLIEQRLRERAQERIQEQLLDLLRR